MRWRLLAAAAVVTLTGVWLGGFSIASIHAAGTNLYGIDFRGAQWIGSPEPAPRAYYRLDLSLRYVPDAATMWVDAEQGFSVFANGSLVVSNEAAARSGRRPEVRAVDLTRSMLIGDDAVVIMVTNWDQRPTAVRARLTLFQGSTATDYLTGSAFWRVTTDVSLVKKRAADRLPRFSAANFETGQWTVAQPVDPIRPTGQAEVPAAVMEAPLAAEVVGGPQLSSDIVASVALDLADDPGDAWFRIIAPGNYVLVLDGDVLTARSSPPPTHLNIYNLGPLLHKGRNVLAIHLTSSPIAALYAEGTIQLRDRTLSVATGRDWGVADSPSIGALRTPPTSRGSTLGPPSESIPNGVVKQVMTAQTLNTPPALGVLARGVTLIALVVIWLLTAGALSIWTALSFSRALCLDGAAHLPAAAVLAGSEQLARFTPIGQQFPHVRAVLIVIIAILLLGKLAAALRLGGVMSGWRPWSRLRIPAPPRPRLPRMAWAAPLVAGLWRRRWGAAIVVAAIVLGGLVSYQLAYEPLWQDEAASLNAAQGMRSHLIPQMPSGFIYWKGELYSAVIAVVGWVTGDTPGNLRIVTVLWYVATVLAFGLLLLPTLMGRRWRGFQIGLTLLFATAPVDLVWARDVRMYQQAQFFAIVFLALFHRALRRSSTLNIAGAAAALVAMYVSHEETFVFLPAVPVVFFAAKRLRWIRDWRWWAFGGGALLLVAVQYGLATFSHPPFFGYDHSNKPYITYDPHNFYWYIRQVYFPIRNGGSLLIVSSLAVLAGVVGVARRSFTRLYLTAFLVLPVLALSTVFSPKISRYVFITMPVLFVLAGLGAADLLGILRHALTPLKATLSERGLIRRLVAVTVIPGIVWLSLSLSGSPGDYGLAAARIAGAPTARHHVDYDVAIAAIRGRVRPTDLIVTLCPPNLAAYYLGRKPDFIIATGRDKLLFLMERDGAVVDTTFGVAQLFTVADIRRLISEHHRIWLITDQGPYLTSVSHDVTRVILAEFDPVSEGARAAVYFRGD